jgi:hypothetical protein
MPGTPIDVRRTSLSEMPIRHELVAGRGESLDRLRASHLSLRRLPLSLHRTDRDPGRHPGIPARAGWANDARLASFLQVISSIA